MKSFYLILALTAVVLIGAGCSKTVGKNTAEIGKKISTSTSVETKTEVTDSQLSQGTWKVVSGVTGFESIELYSGGRYSSFLHDRPFDDGRWLLDKGELQLDSVSGDEQSYLFTSVMIENDQLILYQGTEKSVWEQIK